MANQLHAGVVGILEIPGAYPAQMTTPKRLVLSQCHHQITSSGPLKLMQNKLERVAKVAEILTRKLSSGAQFLKVGGSEKIFRYNFTVKEGEKLLKATLCCLSTTAGPIAGVLFISTNRVGVAFCSQRSIVFSSPNDELVRILYKVSIPVGNILRTRESQNMDEPSQKYIEIVTVEDFDFWFMGLLNCGRTLKYLHQAIPQDHSLHISKE